KAAADAAAKAAADAAAKAAADAAAKAAADAAAKAAADAAAKAAADAAAKAAADTAAKAAADAAAKAAADTAAKAAADTAAKAAADAAAKAAADAAAKAAADAAAKAAADAAAKAAADAAAKAAADAAARAAADTAANTNNPPTANSDTAIVSENSLITGSVTNNDRDPEGGNLTVTNSGTLQGSYGTLILTSSGSYSYVTDSTLTNSLYEGELVTDNFTYTIRDSASQTDTTTLSVTITGTNDGPVASIATASLNEEQTTTGQITATDIDLPGAASLTFSTTEDITGLTLNSDGSYQFDASGYEFSEGEQQQIDIPITVTDDQGATDTTTLSITITGTNDGPVASIATASLNEEQTTTGQITATDIDLPGATSLTFSTTADITGLTLNSDGSYQFDASGYEFSEGEQQQLDIPITVADDQGATDTTTLSITITGTNDGPIASNDTITVDEDETLLAAALNGVIQSNDIDPEQGPLTVTTIRTGIEQESGTEGTVGDALTGSYGTLTLNQDGSYQYSADHGRADLLTTGETVSDLFTYTITDNQGATDSATLTFSITAIEDGIEVNTTATTTDDFLIGEGTDATFTLTQGENIGGSDTIFGGSGTDTIAFQSLNNLTLQLQGDTSTSGTITVYQGRTLTAEDTLSSMLISGIDGYTFAFIDNSSDSLPPSDLLELQGGYGYLIAGDNSSDDEINLNSLSLQDPVYGAMVYGLGGDDILTAFSNGTGGDDLFGGAGNDTLIGGDQSDMLFGGTGDDKIITTISDDRIDGGDGYDTLKLTELSNLDMVITQNASETGSIDASGLNGSSVNQSLSYNNIELLKLETTAGLSNHFSLQPGSSDPVRVIIDDANTSLNYSNITDQQLVLMANSDNSQSVTLSGGTQNDRLVGGSTVNDTLHGGSGDDLMFMTTSHGIGGHDLIDGSEGFDSLILSDLSDIQLSVTMTETGSGTMTLTDLSGSTTLGTMVLSNTEIVSLSTTYGDYDYISLQNSVEDVLVVINGSDTTLDYSSETNSQVHLIASREDNTSPITLLGGSQSDNLVGNSTGDDQLSGGTGNDYFSLSQDHFGGNDTIDGGDGSDNIHLSQLSNTQLEIDQTSTGTGTITLTSLTQPANQSTIQFTDTEFLQLTTSGANSATVSLSDRTSNLTRVVIDDVNQNIDYSAETSYQLYLINSEVDSAVQYQGGSLDDTLISSGQYGDTLSGHAGNDTLIGGAGADQLFGGSGSDALWLSEQNFQSGDNATDVVLYTLIEEHNDTIYGYEQGADLLRFDATQFNSSVTSSGWSNGLGTLSADNFVFNGTPLDSDDYFYTQISTVDSNSIDLFYDVDGNGTGDAIKIAQLDSNTNLSHTDIQLDGSALTTTQQADRIENA
ncbi:MAG: hypothetical protein HOK69_11385, partial [Gammaproteobacteria bacterium]|nr:hypothetical protein [Gammaproteobacteria bacterium]